MELSAPATEGHRALSDHGLAFVRHALADERYLRSRSFDAIQERELLSHYKLQNWPVLVDAARLRDMGTVAVGLDRLAKDVPRRFFALDARRVAEFYGLRIELAEGAVEEPTGIERAGSRADYILSADGLKLLEFNCGSFLGGWYFPLLAPLYLEHPLIQAFLDSRGLRATCPDSVERLFRHLADEAVAAGLAPQGELNVALTLRAADPDSEVGRRLAAGLARVQQTFQARATYEAHLRAALPPPRRGRLFHCSHADFEAQGGALHLEGQRVHAILEYVGRPSPQVKQAVRAGQVHLYAGPAAMLLNDKRNLALLSEHAGDARLFSPAERRLIEAHVPWTRLLRAGRVEYHGESVELVELVSRERERLVLKQGLNFGGHGVHLGRLTTADEWTERVRRALEERNWLVQEHVEGLPLAGQHGEEGACEHDAVWGLFVFGGRPAGVFLRLQPRAQTGVINLAQGALAAIVLEVE